MLEAVDLYKTFKNGNREVYPLLGASLCVEEGDRIGIFGKSGEGKSTFANIACGLTKPDSGNVYLDERPLFDESKSYDFRAGKRIQLIPQQPYLSFDPAQRIGSAVAEVVRVNGRGVGRAEARNKVAELFDRVLLNPSLMNRLPSQLSGGQVQRAAIARALAMNPEAIISDEATSMLDATSQAQIIRIFCDLAHKDGIAIILISHDMKLLRSFADKIYRLDKGVFQLVRDKSAEETADV